MVRAPAFQFYTGDWRKDPCVQALDHDHKGVWIDLICIMWDSEERGRLVFRGLPMPDAAIARNLGLPEAEWKQKRSTLLAYGVASEDERGCLYCRRMVREEDIRQKKVAAGRLGGLVSKPPSKTEAKRGSSVAVAVAVQKKAPTEPKKRRAKKSWRFVPPEWPGPTTKHRALATELGVNVTAAEAKFRDHEFKDPRSDPSRAFSNWLRTTAELGHSNGKSPEPERKGFWADPKDFEPGGMYYTEPAKDSRAWKEANPDA